MSTASGCGSRWPSLIEQCLAQDPRPAYQKPEPGRRYGVRLWDLDVHWHYPRPDLIRVLDVAGGD